MEKDNEARKSAVRRLVTYGVVLALIVFNGFALVVLFTGPQPDIKTGLGVLVGFNSIAALIIGFWFGTRNKPEPSA